MRSMRALSIHQTNPQFCDFVKSDLNFMKEIDRKLYSFVVSTFFRIFAVVLCICVYFCLESVRLSRGWRGAVGVSTNRGGWLASITRGKCGRSVQRTQIPKLRKLIALNCFM